MQIKKIKKKDYKKAINYAIVGMDLKRYFSNNANSKLLKVYGKYFFYLELLQATRVIAAYEDNNLVGVLLVNIKGQKKIVKSPFKKLYVKLVSLFMSIFYKNTASVYDKANQEMFAKYKETNNPDGEILFLVSDPNCLGKGVGTFLLSELQRVEKDKTIYVYTDDQCIYQFYEHRGFIKEGEKDIVMEFDDDIKLKCMLFSKKL